MSMIAFSCECGKQELVPDSFAGLQAKCSSCGRLVLVPPQSNGSSAPPPAPPALSLPPAPLPSPAAAEPLTSPRTLGKISVLLGVGSLLLPVVLGIPALIVGGVSFLAIRRSNGLLPGKGLALAGMGLGAATTVLSLLVLFVVGTVALIGNFRSKPSAATNAIASPGPGTGPEQTPSPTSSAWKVIFRSSDASIWNDDINKGPDHFAMSLDLAPDSLRYLRLTNVNANDYVILEMTKERLRQTGDRHRPTADGDKYGWEGRNQFNSGSYHLGIYHKIWPVAQSGDICVCPGPLTRGWGFGHGHFVNGSQGYSWAGKKIGKTVFEIAVSSESLTDAESKKLLKKGVVRE
jgi:hypothetical protein